MFASLRVRLFEERGAKCEGCGLDIRQLEEFFRWWGDLLKRHKWSTVNYYNNHAKDWPEVRELRESMGYKGYNDLWECNHKLALAEGGNMVDPDNLEILCLKCHRKHTAALKRRLAQAKKEN